MANKVRALELSGEDRKVVEGILMSQTAEVRRYKRALILSLNKSRIRDFLRHTFVVRRINAWAEQGVDVESMLPFLSGYLGHAGPSETYYYYHQTIDAIRLVRDVDRVCLRVIPGVGDDG